MKMNDDELLKLVEDEERTSLAYLSGELSDDRAQNMELFMGDKTRELAPVEGRSSVISMDVMEAVESIMPSLMKIFAGGEEVVRFNPVSAEDEKQAEQETDYVNYVITQQNNWYLVAYQWIKDCLINKNSYVKYWWDETEDTTEETYTGLTDIEFQMLLEDKSIEPIEHTQYVDPLDPMSNQIMEAANAGDLQAQELLAQIPMLHDVKIKKKITTGKVKIEPCAPEEILISADERSLDVNEIRFFEHRSYKTISELREMGYDVDDDIAGEEEGLEFSEEWLSRQQFVEEESYRDMEPEGANRRVVCRECYYKVDFDGDGIAERRLICVVGRTILNNQAVDDVPFAPLTPFIMPHMHIGKALADYIKDVQIIKSTILRNMMDNIYAMNNARTAVSDKVNLDDLLVSRPGGVVRVKGTPAAEIMPMPVAPLNQSAYPMMEYLDTIKETRTGITKYNQGMDANSLNKTASGISQIMSAAQQRQELIARTFAETGIKQLFLGVHKLLLQNSKQDIIVKLRNEWIPVNPRQWKHRTDMTVSVGLGTGNKQEMLGQIVNILGIQEKALQLGIASPTNIYNACVELTKNAGFKDADKYWTNPSEMQQQPQKPDPELIKLQADQQMQDKKLQADVQKHQATMMAEQQAAELQAQKDIQKAQLDMEERRHKAELDYQLELQKLPLEEAKLRLEKYTVDENNKAKLMVAGINFDAKMFNSNLFGQAEEPDETIEELKETVKQLAETVEQLKKPKRVIRDKAGKIIGAE